MFHSTKAQANMSAGAFVERGLWALSRLASVLNTQSTQSILDSAYIRIPTATSMRMVLSPADLFLTPADTSPTSARTPAGYVHVAAPVIRMDVITAKEVQDEVLSYLF